MNAGMVVISGAMRSLCCLCVALCHQPSAAPIPHHLATPSLYTGTHSPSSPMHMHVPDRSMYTPCRRSGHTIYSRLERVPDCNIA
ncbi:hypothetical protein DL89DRAFT_268671, partial [Linderina pennispora]